MGEGSRDDEVASSKKNRIGAKIDTLFMTKMAKIDPQFMTKTAEKPTSSQAKEKSLGTRLMKNHTLWGRT